VDERFQQCIESLETIMEQSVAYIEGRLESTDPEDEDKRLAGEAAQEEAFRVREELEKDDELERLRKEVEQLRMEARNK
jgi:hypothetical protein